MKELPFDIIYENLSKKYRPVSQLIKELPELSKGKVYRTLRELTDIGWIQRVDEINHEIFEIYYRRA